MASLALGGSAEVSVGEDKWRHEGPEVEEEADPAGNDLDPHGGPLAGYILELCIRAVPAGHGHHDVQGGQAEQEVEEKIVVLNALLLVVQDPPGLSIFFIASAVGRRIAEDHALTS